MRRKMPVKAEIEEYSKRIIQRYAYFPKVLKDNYFVWLEKYYVKQTYYIIRRKGEWYDTETWSESTEQSKFLKSIKYSEECSEQYHKRMD